MPKAGFKSITIKKETVMKLEEHFIKNKSYYQSQGINSFNGFVQKKMIEMVEEKARLRKLASKIDTIPEKFLETKLVIKIR